jgi:hypothetical protein
MFFYRYGIAFERLEEKHLEMVRQWRNKAFVRKHMQYNRMIGKKAQQNWFANLDPKKNWYFLASVNGHAFAVLHIKNINWSKKSGEAGAFVGEKQFVGSPDAAFAILSLMDFSFFILGLTRLEAKYHQQFKEIMQLNAQLGYKIYANEADGFVRAKVTPYRYLKYVCEMRKIAQKLYGDYSTIKEADKWLKQHIKRKHTGYRLLSM